MFGFDRHDGERDDRRHARMAERFAERERYFAERMARGERRLAERFGRHGHGGRRRRFDGDELRLLLLALIAETPRHGYDLIREIEDRTGGTYGPSPGVVYPTLTLLDEMGLIEEIKEDGTRRRFAATEAGRAHLEEKKAEVEALLARLAELGEDRARTDRAPVRRAMTNLGMALRDKMAEAGGETDRAHDVAAILDEATRRIERL